MRKHKLDRMPMTGNCKIHTHNDEVLVLCGHLMLWHPMGWSENAGNEGAAEAARTGVADSKVLSVA